MNTDRISLPSLVCHPFIGTLPALIGTLLVGIPSSLSLSHLTTSITNGHDMLRDPARVLPHFLAAALPLSLVLQPSPGALPHYAGPPSPLNFEPRHACEIQADLAGHPKSVLKGDSFNRFSVAWTAASLAPQIGDEAHAVEMTEARLFPRSTGASRLFGTKMPS